jgi:hypothetical protein
MEADGYVVVLSYLGHSIHVQYAESPRRLDPQRCSYAHFYCNAIRDPICDADLHADFHPHADAYPNCHIFSHPKDANGYRNHHPYSPIADSGPKSDDCRTG